VLFGVLGYGITWLLVETVAFAAGMLLILHSLYRRVLPLKRAVIWFVGFYAMPVLALIAWIMVARPVYRRRPEYPRGSDTDRIDALSERHPDCGYLHLARSLSAGGAMSFSADSSCRLIEDGKDYFSSVLEDIRGAERCIYAEVYQIKTDETSAEFMEVLCAKAREGLDVRVIFDDFGYDAKDKRHLRAIGKAGGQAVLFHNMTLNLLSPKKNARNHRKTVVVDGRIAYQGGFNIGDAYVGKGRLGTWRDAAVRIEGPQAMNLAHLFAGMWAYAAKTPLDLGGIPAPEPCGDTPVQIVPGDPPSCPFNPVESMYVSLFRHARRRVWIETPYFVPTEPVLKALVAAAASGTDVRIILPDQADHSTAYWGSRRFALTAMQHGIRVYECSGFVHAKTVLVDDDVCCVGTTNLDRRSVRTNFECSAVIRSEKVAADLAGAFESDLSDSEEYTEEKYRNKGFPNRVKTALSLLFVEHL